MKDVIGWISRIWRKIKAEITKPRMEEMSKSEVAAFIEGFINHDDTRRPYDWDDFVSFPLAAPELDRVRILCAESCDRYPPARKAVGVVKKASSSCGI